MSPTTPPTPPTVAPSTSSPPGSGLTLASRAGRWLLAVAVLGSALAQLEATVVNVALPSIGAHFGAGITDLQWVLNAYLLALASLVLLVVWCRSL